MVAKAFQCATNKASEFETDAQRVWDVRPAVTSGNGVSAQAQRAQKDPSSQIPKVSNDVAAGLAC